MLGIDKKKNLIRASLMLDLTHIIIGGLIVAMAVASFLNPEGNMLLFPIIFFLAAILNLTNGIYKIHSSRREKKKKLTGLGIIIFGILLLILGVVSAVSIWWG